MTCPALVLAMEALGLAGGALITWLVMRDWDGG